MKYTKPVTFTEIVPESPFLSTPAHQSSDEKIFYHALRSFSRKQIFTITLSVLVARVSKPLQDKYQDKRKRIALMESIKKIYNVKTAWCGRETAITLDSKVSQRQLDQWAADRITKKYAGSKRRVTELMRID